MAKKVNERKEVGFRIIIGIVSGIILGVWGHLIFILFLINLLLTLINEKRNKEIAEFCEYLNTETYKFIRYLTFVSNKRPFPFSAMERMGKFS